MSCQLTDLNSSKIFFKYTLFSAILLSNQPFFSNSIPKSWYQVQRTMTTEPIVVDLRSDTVTRPTELMKKAMLEATLGDDVYGEDPTVNALEAKVAGILGKEAALFVASGTMANLIATMVHCDKRDSEMLCGDQSHVYKREGSIANLTGVKITALRNAHDGTFDLDNMRKQIKGFNIHETLTMMVSIENTHSFCGGKVLPLIWLEQLAAIAKEHALIVHMDGARLFNASEYLRVAPEKIACHCDSLSVCFSKGLGAPVGSALAGTRSFINQARRYRKMLGGGMRQSGVLAAAAIVALHETKPSLTEDHRRALYLAKEIKDLNSSAFAIDLNNQQTNIVQVEIKDSTDITSKDVAKRLSLVAESEEISKSSNELLVKVLASAKPDPKTLRFVFHYDVNDQALQLATKKILCVFKEMEIESFRP